MSALAHIRIVMVNTSHPGNIGAAARAMKNMGLADLALVQPKDFPSGEAVARASGADDVLAAARVCDTLDEALADRELLIGASARLRSIAWPQLNPRECAARVTTASPQRTAILFGREHSGLTNEELERCHFLLHIPCNPEYSSLNVAAAIQVVTYELYQAALTDNPASEPVIGDADIPATGEEMESFYGHLETTLRDIGYFHATKHEMSILRRLRRIYNRAQLQQKELHLLRGILTAIQRKVG